MGSASKRYGLYSGGHAVFSAHFEKDNSVHLVVYSDQPENREPVSEAGYERASSIFFEEALKRGVISAGAVELIAVRIVAPGEFFRTHCEIDEEYIKKLQAASEFVALHANPTLKEISVLKELFPGVRFIGISDSFFHKDMPILASRYAIPEVDADRYGIYRYGYHGISISSVVRRLSGQEGGVPKRTIVCHLGSGSSITAIKDGVSVDTSMGFSPLEGVPMGTRVGSIDIGAALFLGKERGLSEEELMGYFSKQSGLLALSGKSSYIYELLSLEREGDSKAKNAIDSFAYSIKKYIGAYMAVLGGVDAVVFTGTAGERSPVIRERVLEGLQGIGIKISPEENLRHTGSTEGNINVPDSVIAVKVMLSDEMMEMALLADNVC